MMFHFLSGLRARLLLLILRAVLPAIGLRLYMAAEQRRLTIAEAQANAARLTQSAALEEDQLINTTRQLLIALAESAEVCQGPPAT